jgi:integrase
MTLSEAREAARSLMAKIDQGYDPVENKQLLMKQERSTIQSQLNEYELDLNRRKVVNVKTAMSALKRGFKGKMSKEIGKIGLVDLLHIIKAIEETGRPGAAQDFRKHASAFMAFCAAGGIIPSNPLAGYRRPRRTRAEIIETTENGRILSDAELAKVWKAADIRNDSFGRIVQFLILSGTRRNEAASLRRSFLEDGWIKYPATFTKQARGHSVPCSRGIAELIANTPNRGELLWPSMRRVGGDTPISGWTQLLRELQETSEVYDFTLHDLRRTFRTWAEEKYGASDSLCEAAIGHVSKQILNRIYSRPKWQSDLVLLFQAWSDHVHKITKGNFCGKNER